MAKNSQIIWGMLGAGALVAMIFLGLMFSGALSTIGEDTNEGDKDTPTQCDSTTTPSLTIDAIDKDNPGTSLTESTNLYREVGKKGWNTFTQGTGFDAVPGQELEIVMGIDTSDQVDNAYGEKFTYTVPCEENPSIEKELAQDEVETDLSATFYNADGDASAETFTADDTQTVSVKLGADSDEYFGNPFISGNPNVFCMDLNKTIWDQPEEVYVKDGETLNSVSMPQRHSAVSGHTTYCYEMPVVDDREVEIMLKLNSDASNAPDQDDTAYMYAGGYYINAETAQVEVGVEDEEGNAVGTDAADSITLDFTS